MSESTSTNGTKLNRREAMLLPGAAGLGGALALSAVGAETNNTVRQAAGSCSTPSTAVAKTQYGKVRGYVESGVLTFKGIPYGQDTGGENRWLPTKAPKPWDGGMVDDPAAALIRFLP
jgi:para-nitrobenzyl esterase